MKNVNKLEILWFSKNYKDEWCNPDAVKFATKYLDLSEELGMCSGNIYRFGFETEDDTYDCVVLIPKFQYKLLNMGMALNKLDTNKLDSEFLEFYLENASDDFEEFYLEVFKKLTKLKLIPKTSFKFKFNMVSPDVAVHFENNKFTGYSS